MNLFESIKTGSLIGKYVTSRETPDESEELHAWFDESIDNKELFNSIKDDKAIASAIEEFETHNKEQAWSRYQEKLAYLSFRKILFRWRVAAVFFFLISCAGILGLVSKEWKTYFSTEEMYTTISTGNRQNSKVTLPDSSVVWINSGTTLSYNTNFAAHNRHIKLVGQAFFQIARNEKMPLTVSCNDLIVKVLGTKFDVCAYPNEKKIDVVLESGKVELLNSTDKSLAYTMSPGEDAEYNIEKKKFLIRNVDSHTYSSWKDGFLIFKDDPMDKVIQKLERWYDIDIEVKDEKINKLIFNATIVNESVEDIFKLIRFTCSVNYKIIPSKDPEIPVKVIISNKPLSE